jgi:uncharacterized protein (DUF1684 family)
MKIRLLSLAILLVVITAAVIACREATAPAPSAGAKAFNDEEMKWRQTRHDRLLKEDGWLSLVGLDWLHEGANDVELPSTPKVTAHVVLAGAKATLQPDPALTIDGKPVAAPVELKDDGDPKPTVVRAGSLSFLFIKRADKNGERYGLRVKDPNSEPRKDFKGLDYFDADPKYRVEAHFEPYNPQKKIAITNVLGMVSDETAPGVLVFTLDGKEYRLEPILEQGETDLFIIFRDATSGKETYGAARYLYAKPPGPDGKTIVDFNHAYNPPCAFTPYATCPLPPSQNRLPIRIEAGEKKYAGGHA